MLKTLTGINTTLSPTAKLLMSFSRREEEHSRRHFSIPSGLLYHDNAFVVPDGAVCLDILKQYYDVSLAGPFGAKRYSYARVIIGGQDEENDPRLHSFL